MSDFFGFFTMCKHQLFKFFVSWNNSSENRRTIIVAGDDLNHIDDADDADDHC